MADVFQKDSEGITLKIKIKPKHIERRFYLTVIIVLAFFVIMGTFCGKCGDDAEETTKQATGGTAEAAASSAGEQNESAAVEEIEEPAINETINLTAEANETAEINETEEEEIIEYSGRVELTINEVMSEIKGDEVQYGKITGVRFTIDNGKDDFMPKVEVYTYEDGDTSSVFAKIPRVERIYSTVKLGKSTIQELEISSQQFPDLDENVVCKVVVKDKDTGDTLVSEESKFKIT